MIQWIWHVVILVFLVMLVREGFQWRGWWPYNKTGKCVAKHRR